ncbi:hypothetical protein BDB00DRAFT_783213 [Zychaea mexicana]|uniref:uncharacterized protein n=1 Tax=Zychaea mexicana TaxID=64656 RepID=UPI0022FEB9AA|nr:uncharacterized protein BDB00DRAFT_783213 [Zychaea mexicana]KAI9499112.1 hypothetical protein BDB00DRAFT_783213 [Zychaea mexicana]
MLAVHILEYVLICPNKLHSVCIEKSTTRFCKYINQTHTFRTYFLKGLMIGITIIVIFLLLSRAEVVTKIIVSSNYISSCVLYITKGKEILCRFQIKSHGFLDT